MDLTEELGVGVEKLGERSSSPGFALPIVVRLFLMVWCESGDSFMTKECWPLGNNSVCPISSSTRRRPPPLGWCQ